MKPRNPKYQEEGEQLRQMREETGLSRGELAARIGISQVTLRNAENGHQRLGLRRFEEAKKACQSLSYGTGSDTCPEVAEPASQPPYSHATNDTVHGEEYICKVLHTAADPDLQALADAMSVALGITKEEAMATLVAKKMGA